MADYLAGNTSRTCGVETFEGYGAWNGERGTANPQNTKVGSFTGFGAAGSGALVVGDGTKLQVRGDNAMTWGRYNTDARAARRQVARQQRQHRHEAGRSAGVGKFNALAFFVIDAADVGGTFSIKVGDTALLRPRRRRRQARERQHHFVRILLSEAVDDLTVELMHDRTNDGFGIDGAMVGRRAGPAAPGGGLLLGLALLGASAAPPLGPRPAAPPRRPAWPDPAGPPWAPVAPAIPAPERREDPRLPTTSSPTSRRTLTGSSTSTRHFEARGLPALSEEGSPEPS